MATQYPAVDWSYGSNIYEVNIRQYTKEGTFSAFQQHLPRLKKMGVKTLWLMPVTPISAEKRKGSLGSYYACSSYTKINPEFGNEDDFRNLVNEAHRLGFKFIIDWVANHTGWEHEWTNNKDWYRQDESGNFTEIHGWDDVIDLNYNNESMQTAMIQSLQYWVTHFNIDGFRCDMAHLVPLSFWHKARKACDALKPLFWLGECDEDNYSEVFDYTYAWRWMHATEVFAKKNRQWAEVKNAVAQYQQLPKAAGKAYFTSNHDENSWDGTEYEKYGTPLARNLAILSCFLPNGIPLIYSGQELPNHKRLLFFDKDEIEWNLEGQPLLHNFYQSLLSLRGSHKVFLQEAGCEWMTVENDEPCIGLFLWNENDKIIALFNFSLNHIQKINFAHEQLAGVYRHLFSGVKHRMNKEESFEVSPNEVLIYHSY